MKSYTSVAVLGACVMAAVCLAMPQGSKDGAIFTNEAIRQAQSTRLIPHNAQIQKVQEGVELVAYESIPGSQPINLFVILGDHVPPEVVSNLQTQVDQVGKQWTPPRPPDSPSPPPASYSRNIKAREHFGIVSVNYK